MRRMGLLVGTLAVLFGAVACSSDDSNASGAPTVAATTATTGGAATTAPPDTTAPPAAQERLYYAKGGALFATEPGGGTVGISPGPTDDQPAPSPDGTKLAFVRLAAAGDTAGELWIADLDTRFEPQLLVPVSVSEDPASSEGEPAAVFRPTFSPDSSAVAFMTTIGLDGGDLMVVDAETGVVTKPDPPLWVSSYAWAPDGRSIVYVSGTNDVSPIDIGVLDLDTLSTQTVVDATAAYGGVTVSPTGDEAIFVNSNLPLPPEGDGGFALAKPGLYSLTLTGGDPTTVAPDPDPDDYRWGARDSAGCLWYARQFAEGTGQVLLHRLCAGDAEPASPVTDLALSPAVPAVAGSNAIAYMVEGDERSLFVLEKPDGDPIHIDDGVTAFGWVQ
jgi:TolB protein